jgi:hypothetical protein
MDRARTRLAAKSLGQQTQQRLQVARAALAAVPADPFTLDLFSGVAVASNVREWAEPGNDLDIPTGHRQAARFRDLQRDAVRLGAMLYRSDPRDGPVRYLMVYGSQLRSVGSFEDIQEMVQSMAAGPQWSLK